MSELLHSGQLQHPDADQLSAFIEQVLPAHERQQVLAHLAVCHDCRETVALSLPNFEAPQQSVPEPVRRRWFHGWTILAPAALVLAASVVIFVSIHHSRATVATPPSQLAASQPPAPVLQPIQAPAPHAVASAEPESLPANGLAPVAHPSERQRMDELAAAPQARLQAIQHAAPPPPAPIVNQEAKAEAAPPRPAMYGAMAGAAQAPAATPPPPANKPAGSVTETIVVTSNAPLLATESASVQPELAPSAARAVVLKHALPGGGQPLSVAVSGKLILAIDAHNALFLSRNNGKHWTAVAAPWQSRAVKVDLVLQSASPAPLAGRMLTLANIASSGPGLTGTVTDSSGAVISNATVTIRNTATNAERKLTTDAAGRYLADNLAPGNYTIDAQAAGFIAQHVNAIAVEPSKQSVENLTLQVGAASQTVEVSADSAAVPLAGTVRDKALKSTPAAPAQPVFTLTTDTGEHWTSPDGISWQRK